MWDHTAGQGMTPQQAQQQTSQRPMTSPRDVSTDVARGEHDGDTGPETERDEASALALDALAADDAAYAALGTRGSAATALTEAMRRAQTRALIREFLRAVPRGEESAVLPLVRADGVARLLTRAQLTTAIDRLRPRQRQIVRLGIEERWPRQKVCAYLRGISMKTLERDQAEALDILAQL